MPTRQSNKLDRVATDIGEIKTTLAVYAEQHKTMCEKLGVLADSVKKQNGRVSRLEAWKNWLVGVGLVIAVIVGAFGRTILEHFAK